jgi:predicted GH43/DUF377 family glycosyl hydrolase
MLTVKREGIILEKSSIPFESHGVFNPAIIEENGIIHLIYRAVDSNMISSLGYCQLSDPTHVIHREILPIYAPLLPCEKMGIEDPRLVKIEQSFYLSYTAYDGQNALGALMTGSELKHLERKGFVVPLIPIEILVGNWRSLEPSVFFSVIQSKEIPLFIWDKNVVFFPRRIIGKLFFFHRIKPFIYVVSINELADLTQAFWETYLSNEAEHLLTSKEMKQSNASYVGAGCPPIETAVGWLFIYHAAYEENYVIVYRIHILLLDIDNPLKVIAELPYSILGPEKKYEQFGNVDHVVFPTGAIIQGDRLFIYYGAADYCIACASISLLELFNEFKHFSS